jgi:hypothetical protein
MTEVPKLTRVASASKWRRLRVWGARTLAALALLGLLGVGVVGWGISTSPGARRAVDAYGFGTSPGHRAVDGIGTSPGRTAVFDQEMEHGGSVRR